MSGTSTGIAMGNVVLNAFRHHRGGHSYPAAGTRTGPWCSTPFGITEVGIRHQCTDRRSRLGCSTPFGITEVGITVLAVTDSTGFTCSTPFGITEVGIGLSADDVPLRLVVLNAFRHHRGGHVPSVAATGTLT